MSAAAPTTRNLLARGTTYLCGVGAMAAVVGPLAGMDPVQLVLGLILLVISLGIHEAAHGWVALKCGDPTARDLGRITLNPIPHIDPFMTLILPAMLFYFSQGRMMFGGAKPVPVNFHRLRHPWRDMSLVALAGPASNLVLAVLFMAGFKFFLTHGLYHGAAPTVTARADDLLPRVLLNAANFNVLLAVFNIVPIPPLDGSRVMAWLLPEGLRPAYTGLERFGLLIVFGLLYLPVFQSALDSATGAVTLTIFKAIPIGDFR